MAGSPVSPSADLLSERELVALKLFFEEMDAAGAGTIR
jgi:hypothetical protein